MIKLANWAMECARHDDDVSSREWKKFCDQFEKAIGRPYEKGNETWPQK